MEWFNHLYPHLAGGEDRPHLMIYHTAHAQHTQKVVDLQAYLDCVFNVFFVSADLQEWVLSNRAHLCDPENYNPSKTLTVSLTNKAVFVLINFQTCENFHYLAAQWVTHLLNIEASEKGLKILNKKIIKLKERKKISS